MEAKHTPGPDWTKPVGETIHVPDELDPMINRVGMQIRFYTISDKGEIETICDIVRIAEEFFYKLYDVEKLKTLNAELIEALESILSVNTCAESPSDMEFGILMMKSIAREAKNKAKGGE